MAFLLPLLLIYAVAFVVSPARAESQTVSFDPSVYTRLLETFVDERGWVDYAGLKARGGAWMEILLRGLEETDPGAMNRKQKMAFYINAYNLFTLKLISDHYPVGSIRKIPGVSGMAGNGQWKKKLWTLNGEKISLDEIEHNVLRPMGDPRIHFALVCASRGCPPLARTAYKEEALDEMLDDQARRFNQDPRGLRTVMEKGLFQEKPILELSAIYKWFREDFLGGSQSLPDYVLPFAADGDRAFIRANREKLRVRFMDYSWKLNEPR